MVCRKPSVDEVRLLKVLILKAKNISIPKNWASKIEVEPLNDGGMGSLTLHLDNDRGRLRKFKSQVSDYHFLDEDGVQVIASLYIDEFDKLFELDIWKTDFSSLIKIP